MKKYIGTFKTNRTLYLDQDGECWDTGKPEYFDKEEDIFLRKGSILKAYRFDDKEFEEYGYRAILESTKSCEIQCESVDDLYNYPYIYEVKKEG